MTSPNQIANESLTSQSADCTLTVTFTHSVPDVLRLIYSVHNHGTSALYLCNQLYSVPEENSSTTQRAIAVLPNLVHVQVVDEGVKVEKSITNLSFHDGVSVLDIPCLTRLEPGQDHEQALDLSLPLVPYKVHSSRPSPLPPAPLPLLFELGYFIDSRELQPFVREVKTVAGSAYCLEPFMAGKQQLIAVGPFHQHVPTVNGAGNGLKQMVSDAAWTPWG
ncbi:MAG: hypothetical protein H7Z75_12380 [Ferruginibacter sp.]|nr:hypothetical protein [Cytophagales bacterium]